MNKIFKQHLQYLTCMWVCSLNIFKIRKAGILELVYWFKLDHLIIIRNSWSFHFWYSVQLIYFFKNPIFKGSKIPCIKWNPPWKAQTEFWSPPWWQGQRKFRLISYSSTYMLDRLITRKLWYMIHVRYNECWWSTLKNNKQNINIHVSATI